MLNKAIPNLHLNIAPILIKYALILLPSSLIGHFVSNSLYFVLPAIVAGIIGGTLAIGSTVFLVLVFGLYEIPEKIKQKLKLKSLKKNK